MATPRLTRSSALGKRAHPQSSSDEPQIPEQTTPKSKRPRVSVIVLDGDGNKENVPPLSLGLLTPEPSPVSSRTARALRRSGTESISPSRKRTSTLRRYPSTPSIASSDSFLATPPPTSVSLPLHTRARALLRPTSNSTDNEIPCRDSERAMIHDFITSFVDDSAMVSDNAPTTLYISGSPGCGKTALVSAVLGHLNPELNGVKIIFINCMALNNLDDLWDRMFQELDAARVSPLPKSRKTRSRDAIESLLSGLQTKCVLILDELDQITPNIQALTSLFSLPAATPSNIRLIGIANTHTLTATPSSSPSLNVQTLHFAPYTSNQLFDILQSRLRPLYDVDSDSVQNDPKKFLPTPALTLLTKKIAGMTGDVRSLFEVLRGAIDIAVAPSSQDTPIISTANCPAPAVSVTPSHILAALKAYRPSAAKSSISSGPAVSNSETVTKVKNLNLQARIVLLSVLLGSKRLEAGLTLSGSQPSASPRKPSATSLRRTASSPSQSATTSVGGMDTNQLHSYYTAILTRSDSDIFDPATRSEFGDLLNILEGNGLVCVSSTPGISGPGRKSFARSPSFTGTSKSGNVGAVRLVESILHDEILRGLGVNTHSQEGVEVDVCEEEAKAIWQREQTRTARDVKNKASVSPSKATTEDVFSGAFTL